MRLIPATYDSQKRLRKQENARKQKLIRTIQTKMTFLTKPQRGRDRCVLRSKEVNKRRLVYGHGGSRRRRRSSNRKTRRVRERGRGDA